MTDKTIIDGVDVSGCRLYDKTTHQLEFNKCGHICKDTECKYKRLWYKKQLTLLQSQYNAPLKQNKSLQKELQKEKQNAQYTHEMYQALMESFNILQAGNVELKRKADYYKQALDKVENKMQEIEPYTQNNILILDDILEIINEVKNITK